MTDLNVFVARQPIFDRSGNIFGYELLYRNSASNSFPKGVDPEQATVDLLVNTFLTIGIDQVVGRKKSFINFTHQALENELLNQLDPNLVIVEILESVTITPEVIQDIIRLRKKGFKVALDDFSLKQLSNPALQELLFNNINIIKIDFLMASQEERIQLETLVKKYRHLSLLAEKIETKEAYEKAKRSGYSLFQGYYFAKPEVIKGKEIPANYLLHFQLMKEFNEMTPSIEKITDLFMRDVSLSYKLLRYINSLAFDIPHEISSINQAIMLMGLRKAKNWLRILLLRDLGMGEGRGRHKALVERSLVRGKLMELLAEHKHKANADEFFLTGLFSSIDLIMQGEFNDIVPYLSLSESITSTLLGEATNISPYLELVIALESLHMEEVYELAEELNLDTNTLINYVHLAYKWATIFD